MESMKGSEAKLLEMIADLEVSLRQKEVDQSARSLDVEPLGVAAAAAASLEQERAKHQKIVDAMQREIDDYRSAANSHVTKLQELEVAYASISQQVEEDSKSRNLSSRELETHKGLVANLQNQLEVHKSAVTIHQESLESLQASHSKEVKELKASMANAERISNERYSTLEQQHKNITESLQRELKTAQSEKTTMLRSASSALGYETDASKLHSQIKGLVEEGKEIHSRHLKKTNELKAVQEELQNALNNTVDLENKISELKTINEETIAGLEKMTEKEKKSSRLVEELADKEKKSSRLAKELAEKEKKSSRLIDELEEQLNNNFDSHQATTNRLSTMQGEVAQQRINLERELENQKMKNLMLEVCMVKSARHEQKLTVCSNKWRPSNARQSHQRQLAISTANRSHQRLLQLPSHDPPLHHHKALARVHQQLYQLLHLRSHFHPSRAHQPQYHSFRAAWTAAPHHHLYSEPRLRQTTTPRQSRVTPLTSPIQPCHNSSRSKKRESARSRSTSSRRSSSPPLSKRLSSTSRPAPIAPSPKWKAGARSAPRSKTSSRVCRKNAVAPERVCRRSKRSAR
jgi:kinesin family protein 4/21/27